MSNCPYCNHLGKFDFIHHSKTYLHCSRCDLIYQQKPRSYEEVITTFRDDYFSSYGTDQVGGGRDSLYDHILQMIQKRKTVGNLLDLGTGCGRFLQKAEKNGWVAKGIEPSVDAAEIAVNQNGLDVFNGTLKNYPRGELFNVITYINVLEQSVEPWQEIMASVNLLKPGGMIYIRFVNGFLHSALMKWATRFGLSRTVKKYLVFHEYAFTPKLIKTILSDCQLKQISVSISPPSRKDPYRLFFSVFIAELIKYSIYFAAKAIQHVGFKNRMLGTSLEAIAFKDSA